MVKLPDLKFRVSDFKSVVFDCDGVLFDTVPFKTNAFRNWVAEKWPKHETDFIDYHLGAYGINRKLQIIHFFENILKQNWTEKLLIQEIDRLSKINRIRIFDSPWVRGSKPFLNQLKEEGMPMFVLSGTPEEELVEFLQRKKVDHLFKRIIGYPCRKEDGLRLIVNAEANLPSEVLFVGDADADAKAAQQNLIPFVYRRSQVRFSEYKTPRWSVDNLMELIESN
jgi:phosphoglycolate phosphatase-like HAD superfamily hydrolase